jgi:hypothetical protein
VVRLPEDKLYRGFGGGGGEAHEWFKLRFDSPNDSSRSTTASRLDLTVFFFGEISGSQGDGNFTSCGVTGA